MAGRAIGAVARVAGAAIAVRPAVVHIEFMPAKVGFVPGFSGCVTLLALTPVMVTGRVVAALAVAGALVVELGAAPTSSVMAGAALPCKMIGRAHLPVARLAISETSRLVIHADIRPGASALRSRGRVAGRTLRLVMSRGGCSAVARKAIRELLATVVYTQRQPGLTPLPGLCWDLVAGGAAPQVGMITTRRLIQVA